MKIRTITLLTLSALCSIGLLSAADVRPGLAPEWSLMSENPHPGLLSLREPDADLALGLAVRRNHPGLVTRLVQAGANVNRRRHGVTAAEYAVQQGCYFAGKAELSSQTQPNP